MKRLNFFSALSSLESVMKRIREKSLGYKSSYRDEETALGYGPQCLYRSPDGNACLVGCFIPDDKYQRHMEGNDVKGLLRIFQVNDDMPLEALALKSFQTFHDEKLSDETGEEFFKKIEEHLTYLESKAASNG